MHVDDALQLLTAFHQHKDWALHIARGSRTVCDGACPRQVDSMAFVSVALGRHLSRNDAHTLLMVEDPTCACGGWTARGTGDCGYNCILFEVACGAPGKATRDKALALFERIGSTTAALDEFGWSASGPKGPKET
jgi:hypothetical protein